MRKREDREGTGGDCPVSDWSRDQLVAALVVRDGQALLCHQSPLRRWYPDVWDLPSGHRRRDLADYTFRMKREMFCCVTETRSRRSSTFATATAPPCAAATS